MTIADSHGRGIAICVPHNWVATNRVNGERGRKIISLGQIMFHLTTKGEMRL